MKYSLTAGLCTLIGAGAAYWLQAAYSQPATTDLVANVTPNATAGELHFAKNAPQLSYIHISAVDTAPMPVLELLQGRVTYDEDITARISTPVAGRVVNIKAKIGDYVAREQPLAVIDAPEFGQAKADKRKADSDLRAKTAAFNRANMLFDGGVLAAKDLESARADFEQSTIEAERALARLRNLGVAGSGNDPSENGAEGFILRAPIHGVVTERQINPGSEVRPDNGAVLFIISDPQTLWVNIDVSERDIEKIHPGQHLQIHADAYPTETFDATVAMLGKVLDPVTRRFTVRCVVHDASEHLKPEMYVHASLLDGSQSLPQVPNDALVVEGIKTFLFVEKSPGVLEKREVSLSHRGSETSFIQSGLHAGERIAVNGALLLNAELQGN